MESMTHKKNCPSCEPVNDNKVQLKDVIKKVEETLIRLYDHDGYAHFDVDMRILKRGQKEIIVRCGEEYRFVVDSK